MLHAAAANAADGRACATSYWWGREGASSAVARRAGSEAVVLLVAERMLALALACNFAVGAVIAHQRDADDGRRNHQQDDAIS